MARRTLATHGQFVLPFLQPGLTVLDCGCGPGTMTCEIAERLEAGRAVGVDFQSSQVEIAAGKAKARGVTNVEFKQATAYELPFEDGVFDLIFSNALMEHLKEPALAVGEFSRVLRPGGVLAVSSPDWGGFLLAPPSQDLSQAIQTYMDLQLRNGGDVFIGRKLSSLFADVGFLEIDLQARYEMYESLPVIGEYLALHLETAHEAHAAAALREWMKSPHGMFAQTWVSCTGRKPK